jgi:hypothetical protein
VVELEEKTAVIVLRPTDGKREGEILRYAGVELRRDREHHHLVLLKGATVIGTFGDGVVERWYYEPA